MKKTPKKLSMKDLGVTAKDFKNAKIKVNGRLIPLSEYKKIRDSILMERGKEKVWKLGNWLHAQKSVVNPEAIRKEFKVPFVTAKVIFDTLISKGILEKYSEKSSLYHVNHFELVRTIRGNWKPEIESLLKQYMEQFEKKFKKVEKFNRYLKRRLR